MEEAENITLADFKKTPFFARYKLLVKAHGWDYVRKHYPGIVGAAEAWLKLEEMRKQAERLARGETFASKPKKPEQQRLPRF